MKWSTLKKLLSGIVGNTVFLVSIISIISLVPFIKIGSLSISIAVTGATILLISYIAYKVIIPDTIDNHIDYRCMYKHLKDIDSINPINLSLEFSMLENNKNVDKLPIFNDLEFNLHKFSTCEEYKEVIGEKTVHYPVVIIKYNLINYSKKKSRALITISFFIGAVLFYYPAAYRIFNVTLEGFN